MEHKTDLDALDAIVGKATNGEWYSDKYGFIWVRLDNGNRKIVADTDLEHDAHCAKALKNAYPAIAAELREAREDVRRLQQVYAASVQEVAAKSRELYEAGRRIANQRKELGGFAKRVRDLEAEIEVRDNSANETLRILREALPNRGFHSEMEAAEAAAAELADLRARLAAAEEQLREANIAKDVAETMAHMLAHPDKSPCGHCETLAHTDDGGKTIHCYVCQLAAATERAERAERGLGVLLQSADVFARAYRVSMEPFGYGIDDEAGAQRWLPGGWPTVGDFKELNSVIASLEGK